MRSIASHLVTSAFPLTTARRSLTPSTVTPLRDPELDRLRELRLPHPERQKNDARVNEATRPRRESPEATQVRRDFRQAWDRAQAYWNEGRRLADRGTTLPNGATEVVTTQPDGSTRSIRFDDTGRVYVQNRGPDGVLTGSLYRSGVYLSTNPFPDFQEAGKPSAVFNVLPDGTLLQATQTGHKTWDGSKVAPDGTVGPHVSPPPVAPADPGAIPRLRQAVPSTGQGVTIGVLDDFDAFRGKLGPHATQVIAVAGGAEHGVAPGAEVVPLARVPGGDLQPSPRTLEGLADDPVALDQAMRTLTGPLDVYARRLGEILDDRDPQMRVLNISAGPSRMSLYGPLYNTLEELGEHGEFRYPKLRREVYGSGDLSEEDMRRKVADYADGRLKDPSSAYQRALRDWQEQTRRGAEAGLTVTVAAANVEPPNVWDQARPGCTLNDLARSPHVIAAGACGPAGVWERSAPGEGPGGVNPTLLAPGVDVPTVGDVVGSGTSFAAPYTAGTVALMLEANPNLSTGDIKRLLQASATPLPGVAERFHGAGVIDAVKAVRLARL